MTVFAVTFCILAYVALMVWVLVLSREVAARDKTVEAKNAEISNLESDKSELQESVEHWKCEFKLAYDAARETSKHHLSLIRTHRERADSPEFDRYTSYMDAGNTFRRLMKRGDAIALLAIGAFSDLGFRSKS